MFSGNGKCSITLAFLVSCNANAIVINENIFTKNGGHLDDVANSIKFANNDLREKSFAHPFFTVGTIAGCTATWLGEDGDEAWVYILTAAHCIPYKGERTEFSATFTSWNGTVIASGMGLGYVPPQRIKRPAGMGGASTDIAILKLPKKDMLIDSQGEQVSKPIIYDGSAEKNRKVFFAGYGTWGVGLNQNGAYFPSNGARRLYGESIITSMYELDYGIGASYKPTGDTAEWARVASGDSGSAWWQQHKNLDVIIATTNGGHDHASTGARVSKYADWIKGIFPEVSLFSDVSKLKPVGCIVSTSTQQEYCLPIGKSSGYSLPGWIYKQEVYVNAAPGTKVVLSDYDNLSYNRLAAFVGTVETHDLKKVKAWNGQYIDFSRPRSMRVEVNRDYQ